MYKRIITMLLFLILTGYPAFGQNSGTFKDVRDGNVYKWVTIGNQIWMAENLRYNAGRGSGYYDLNLYGRIYNWNTAKKACPPGWHLPSDAEWKVLERTLGMSESDLKKDNYDRTSGDVGIKLKSKSGWRFYMQNGNGMDLYGFNALPGGYYQTYNKRFMYYGSGITFWTSSSFDRENAITRELGSHYNGIGRGRYYKVHGCYVRCVKN